jgi:hypothetical protein
MPPPRIPCNLTSIVGGWDRAARTAAATDNDDNHETPDMLSMPLVRCIIQVLTSMVGGWESADRTAAPCSSDPPPRASRPSNRTCDV